MFLGDFKQRGKLAHARVVHHQVDRAECVEIRVEQAAQRLVIAYVGSKGERLRARFACEPAGVLRARPVVAVVHTDVVAVLRQCDRDRLSDAVARAGNQRLFSFNTDSLLFSKSMLWTAVPPKVRCV